MFPDILDEVDSFMYHTTLKPCARHYNENNAINIIEKMHAGSNENFDARTLQLQRMLHGEGDV